MIQYSDFLVSNQEFDGCTKNRDIYIHSDQIYQNKNVLLIRGDVFYPTSSNKDFIHELNKDIKILNKTLGQFALLFYDISNNTVYFAVDKIGIETLFYYYKNGHFIISTNFWSIINIVNKDLEIDIQSAKEQILFHKSLSYNTIIKNINIVEPSKLYKININKSIFSTNNYWTPEYDTNKLKDTESVEKMNEDINNNIKQIINKYGKSPKYAIGISGGLDTRIIPHYLLNNDIKINNIKSFQIGEKKPHKLVYSRDHKSALDITNYYDLNHDMIEYNYTSYDNKMLLDIKRNLHRSSNLLISIDPQIINADILITGGYGVTIGGNYIIANIENLNVNELTDLISSHRSVINLDIKQGSFIEKYISIFKYLYKKSLDRELKPKLERKSVPFIATIEDVEKMTSKIKIFIEENKKNGLNNQQILHTYQNYLAERNAAFEGLNGDIVSFSIYYPYVFENVFQWENSNLLYRKILIELISKKFPELSKIPGQDNRLSIADKNINKLNDKIKKIYLFILYIVRGQGLNHTKWSESKDFLIFAQKTLLRKNKLFDPHFDAIKIYNNRHLYNQQAFQNLIKIKYILDVILYKEYDKLLY